MSEEVQASDVVVDAVIDHLETGGQHGSAKSVRALLARAQSAERARDEAVAALKVVRNLCVNWANRPDFNPTLTEVHEFAAATLSTTQAQKPEKDRQ